MTMEPPWLTCVAWSGRHDAGRPVLPGAKRNGKTRSTKRVYKVLWEMGNGSVPEGMSLHHTCHNPWCIQIMHLVPMTKSDHSREHTPHPDWKALRPHCPQGHPYDEANTYIPPGHPDQRMCRTCRRISSRLRYRERRSRQQTGRTTP